MKKKETPKKEMTVSEFARLGGNALLKKHGKGYYVKMAKKRWKNEKASKKLVK